MKDKRYKFARKVQAVCGLMFLLLAMACENCTIWHVVAAVIISAPLIIATIITKSYEDDEYEYELGAWDEQD